MKIVILGAGALGTVLGAHFARAGEDVTLIARGQRAARHRAVPLGAVLSALAAAGADERAMGPDAFHQPADRHVGADA